MSETARVGDELIVRGLLQIDDTPNDVHRELWLSKGDLKIHQPLIISPIATWRAHPSVADFGLMAPQSRSRREIEISTSSDQSLRIVSRPSNIQASIRRVSPRLWKLNLVGAPSSQRFLKAEVVLARSSGSRIAIPVVAFSSESASPQRNQ